MKEYSWNSYGLRSRNDTIDNILQWNIYKIEKIMEINKSNYLNRELSWLEFNFRVLEEAIDKDNPLLERLKFLAIFANNLDEFLMVRVSGLIEQVKSNYLEKDLSGLSPVEILEKLQIRIAKLTELEYNCFNQEIIPGLEKEGYKFYNAENIPEEYKESLKKVFMEKYFLMLTPMAVDISHPFPFLPGKKLNILATIEDPENQNEPLFAVIPVPSKKRLIQIPDDNTGKKYIFIEELIKLFLFNLFKGYKIKKTCVFRVTRDAELSIDEEDAMDLLSAIQNELKKREKGTTIRLEVEADADAELLKFLFKNIYFYKGFYFPIYKALDLSSFFELDQEKNPVHLKDRPLAPVLPIEFISNDVSIFNIISKKDRIIHHPYESFDPVVRFVREAANDPNVLAIKQTLYRTSGDSPVVTELKKAAENGKQVTVLIELKARFDEAQNINWAKQLEQSGCYVIYGLVGLKTHCKITLVVREEENGIKRYIHLSTGNYNDKTAKVYTDIGMFTARNSFGSDVSATFNLLTGYSEPPRWKKLVCAPLDLRNFFLEKIEIEKNNTKNGGKGKIIAKMNALTDPKIIEALYEASVTGVNIQLIVRGMCCLIPGIKGISENISVNSIVDRFLEHSRIYYFYNSGEEDIYLASADWMERNFDRRIETLFPVEDNDIKQELINILKITLSDNQKTRILQSDGNYIRKKIKTNEKQIRSQIEIYNYFLNKNKIETIENKPIFIPKTNP